MGDPIEYKQRGPAIDDQRIVQFEKKLGQRLPEDFRLFLLQTNGCVPAKTNRLVSIPSGTETILQVLYGLDAPDDFMNLDDRLEGMQSREQGQYPSEAIPIGNDGFGNKFTLAIAGERRGEVFLQALDVHPDRRLDTEWHRTRQFQRVASSFGEFLQSLKPVP